MTGAYSGSGSVFDTGLAAVMDTFAIASELSSTVDGPEINVRLVGFSRNVKTARGLHVSLEIASSLRDADILVVPALGAKTPTKLALALKQREIIRAGELLLERQACGGLIAAACTGTFVLAESGLLKNHTVTTSWWLSTFFRERYSTVTLDEHRMLVRSDNLVTAGAALAHFDLALWLVRQASPALAATTASYMIIDSRPSQSIYAISDHLVHNDPVVARFECWAHENLPAGFSLDKAASAAGASSRTLARRMQTVLGKTPLGYFQDLRIEHAIHLLRTTNESISKIASRVGYTDGVTLRNLLRRRTGLGIVQLRSMKE